MPVVILRVMEIIDTHSHLDDPSFANDIVEVLERANQVGVSQCVVPAIQASGWAALRQLCRQYPQLQPAYGLHPMYLSQHREQDLIDLAHWLNTGNPVAVGECGLDFFIPDPDKKRQQYFFEAQLELAHRYRLPVIIHARKAVEQVIQILRQFSGLRGVLHSFSGSKQQAERLIDLGFMMSFGGPASYPNAHRLHRLITWMPIDSLLLETDSPDQPDATHRGERNEPAYLPAILQVISRLKDVPPAQLAEATTRNARRLFNLPPISAR
ncbi:TatD family hydrolase [Sedimenticola sp.]|uniref:TatD family hydrolase n=1 Tax=Sedimenticola sp. TaxID=1940285 RepID=UPI003D0F69B9